MSIYPATQVRQEGGWIPLTRLALIRVGGPQRVKFLHNLLSNDITGLLPGQSRSAALMNLKGQQVAWMRVLAEPDALICELPFDVRQTVVDTFIHYKVGAPVRFEQPESAIFGVFGPKGESVLQALGFTEVPAVVNTFGTATAFGGTLRASRGDDMPAQGFTLHADATNASQIEDALRAAFGDVITDATLDVLRIEEGMPWYGLDVKEENLLHETGQLNVYHSSSKGCYLGQEVVARLEGRGGNVNKRLRGLKSSIPMTRGDEIFAEEKSIGRITTAGESPDFGFIAMGYVHRAHSEPGTRVIVSNSEAEVIDLPFKR